MLVAAASLQGCASQSVRVAVDEQTSATAQPLPSLPAGDYRIEPAQSEIRLLVYRAGPLAQFGHNHVIINRDITGTAHVERVSGADERVAAAFSLSFPVSAFIVDDVQARSEEGDDFSAEVSDDARAGTLRNLLSTELLNAAAFPTVTLLSTSIAADRGGMVATVALNVAGHPSTLAVPFVVQATAGLLRASGQVTLRQSALGLTPFRALLGALAVQDEFTVKFELVAVPL